MKKGFDEILKEIYKYFLDEREDNPVANITNEIKVKGRFILLDCLDVVRYDMRLIDFALIQIKNVLEFKYNINALFLIRYNDRQKVLFMSLPNKEFLNFEIPYYKREEYFEFIYKVNQNIERDGCVIWFVNNNIYSLKSYIYIETERVAEIRKIAKVYKVKEKSIGKSIEYYISELPEKKWNISNLLLDTTLEEIKNMEKDLYFFKSKCDMEASGYIIDDNYEKVFLSYSYKDRDVIEEFQDKLKLKGIPIWKDEYDIKFGESITERIDEAMRECKIILLCVSENTKNSFYANEEVRTSYKNYLLSKEKSVITVVLDDSDPKDIITGLSNYKYVRYKNEDEVRKLILQLEEELSINL